MDYKQSMFHFNYPRNSIDARKPSKEELDWVVKIAQELFSPISPGNEYDSKTAYKLLELWFPEKLIGI